MIIDRLIVVHSTGTLLFSMVKVYTCFVLRLLDHPRIFGR